VNPATGAGFFCHDLAGMTLEASAVKVMQGGTWVQASPSTGSLSTPPARTRFDCPQLTFSIVHANDDWSARVGAAHAGDLIGNGTANFLQFNNISATAGAHQVTVFYASGENRALTISAYGAAATTPNSGGWDTVTSVTTTLNLNAGANTLRIANPAGWAPDIDRITVS
jgi:hypothetical protein